LGGGGDGCGLVKEYLDPRRVGFQELELGNVAVDEVEHLGNGLKITSAVGCTCAVSFCAVEFVVVLSQFEAYGAYKGGIGTVDG
jgi:hypothetical protein